MTSSSAWRPCRRTGPATLLTVCEHGFGKRTTTSDYPTKNRGGKGVITIKTTERNAGSSACAWFIDEDDLMLITSAGKLIRMPVAGIPTIGRKHPGRAPDSPGRKRNRGGHGTSG